jgi:hypothetical protein
VWLSLWSRVYLWWVGVLTQHVSMIHQPFTWLFSCPAAVLSVPDMD